MLGFHSFLFFINLYYLLIPVNSLINKRYNSFVMNYFHNYKANIGSNIGCDYYIDKDLYVYDHNDTAFIYINLEHKNEYYLFKYNEDEDENEDDKEISKYIDSISMLEPIMKPIVIYSNNIFNKLFFENKYKIIIENELNILNKSWNDVKIIIKEENRYKK